MHTKTNPNTAALEALGLKLADAALRTLVRLCPEIRTASPARQAAACAAMRTQVGPALDELLDDAQAAPWLAEVVFSSAVMTLVNAGIQALRANDAN